MLTKTPFFATAEGTLPGEAFMLSSVFANTSAITLSYTFLRFLPPSSSKSFLLFQLQIQTHISNSNPNAQCGVPVIFLSLELLHCFFAFERFAFFSNVLFNYLCRDQTLKVRCSVLKTVLTYVVYFIFLFPSCTVLLICLFFLILCSHRCCCFLFM